MALIKQSQRRRALNPVGQGGGMQKKGLTNVQPSSSPTGPVGNQGQPGGLAGQGFPTGPPRSTQGASPSQSPGKPKSGGLVSRQANRIARSNSPIMDRARTQAKQYANRRGLLNSSLAAGAAEGAVLDRATGLAQADVSADLETARLKQQGEQFLKSHDLELMRITGKNEKGEDIGLDRERLQLEKARLEEQKRQFGMTHTQRGSQFDRTLSLQQNEQNLAERERNFRRTFDRDRFNADESYRRDALAQERDLREMALEIETARLAQQESQFGRSHSLAVSGQEQQESQFARSHGLATRSQTTQETQFDKLHEQRETQFTQTHELATQAQANQVDQFGKTLSLQEKNYNLQKEEREFRRTFDQERFDSDEAYRRDTLAQEKAFQDQRIGLDLERLGVDLARYSVDQQNAIANSERENIRLKVGAIQTLTEGIKSLGPTQKLNYMKEFRTMYESLTESTARDRNAGDSLDRCDSGALQPRAGRWRIRSDPRTSGTSSISERF